MVAVEAQTRMDERLSTLESRAESGNGFSAAAALANFKSSDVSSSNGENSMAIVASQSDSVASRVNALYDKIRDPAPGADGPSRETGVRTMSNTASKIELIENQIGPSDSRQEELSTRLKSLDNRFTKAQSIEAEKYKLLRMLTVRAQDDCGVEKCSLDVIKERYDREVQSMETSILLDLNVHRQARRDLDKQIARQIDDKFGIFQAELVEEQQARMDAATRSSLDPSLIPTLTANIEQEGMLRYDRGEQLLERIRDKTVCLHNMLACEEEAQGHMEEFTSQIAGRCGELRVLVEEEKSERARLEQHHAQRLEQLRDLSVEIHSDRTKRVRHREQINGKIKEEMSDFFNYVQQEQKGRQKSEEYILKMVEESTGTLEEDIKTERSEREGSEEQFFKLLEETCARARNRL
jgi:hypothetical protein